MPAYNVENYVSVAIESILSQTYSNFELIIVDDCSTDLTYTICQKYAFADKRIRLFHNAVNLSIAKTLNVALSYATGWYIVRMDADDVSDSKRFETMKKYLEAHPDISLVGTSANTIDADGNFLGKTIFLSNQDLINRTLKIQIPVVHIWMTYKQVYDQLGNYRQIACTEDYDFILRLATAGLKFTNLSDYFGYSIRVNRIGNTSNIYGVRKLKSKQYVINLYKERLKYGFDTFSVEKHNHYIRTCRITDVIYRISCRCLYNAITLKGKHNFFGAAFYIFCALISPYQIKYIYERALYKILTRAKLK